MMEDKEKDEPRPEKPIGKPSAAEIARKRLEQQAAERGICPDCGFDVKWCEC